jgi:hypothetical protein
MKACSRREEGRHYTRFVEREHGSGYLHQAGRGAGDADDPLMEALEDNDDVQNVHANFDIDQKVLEEVAG